MNRRRIPLNTLAVPFGLSGLAETWTATSAVFSLPAIVAELFWLLAAAAWLSMIAAHAARGVRVHQPLIEQLRHPAQGPIAALVPVVGMLLGAQLYHYLPTVGASFVVLSITAAALFAGWIISRWLRGVEPTAVHGGYLLPTVASGLIGGATAADVGLPDLGWGAFAVGIVFWLIIFAILLVRLGALPVLPGPLTPTLAILVAPPAVAGLAWTSLTGQTTGPAIDALIGLTVLSVLIQAGLLPLFRRTPFSLGAWSFTFPFAAVATFLISATAHVEVLGPFVAITGATAITVLIATIAYRSVRLLDRSEPAAESQLTAADNRAEAESSVIRPGIPLNQSERNLPTSRRQRLGKK